MSLWLDEPYTPRAPLGGDAGTDVAVIGGGITGIAAALFLARRKVKVIVLERGTIGCGATGRSAGFLLAGVVHHYAVARKAFSPGRAKDLWRLSIENHDLIAAEKIDCLHARRGSAHAAESPREMETLRTSAEMLRADGFEAEFREEKERGFHGTLVTPRDGEFHPVRFVRGLAAAAERAGATIAERTRVVAWSSSGTDVRIRTDRGDVRATMMLLATNAYTGRIAPYFEDVITPVRGQILATAPLAQKIIPQPTYADYGYQYFRQLDDGRILMGGGRKESVDTELTLSDKPTDTIQAFLEEYLHRHYPETRGLAVTHRWAGTMGFSCDELPSIGPLPGVVNVYASAGYHGHGLGFAVVAAKMATGMMIDGKTDARAEMFAPRRHAL